MSKNNKPSFFSRLTGGFYDREENADKSPKADKTISVLENGETELALAVDMHQTPSDIIITAMVAGVRPENLEVDIGREAISIKGSRMEQNETAKEDYFYQELYWGSFSRTIVLPQEVDPDIAEAVSKNGILLIRLPKINKEKKKSLKVKCN